MPALKDRACGMMRRWLDESDDAPVIMAAALTLATGLAIAGILHLAACIWS